MTAWVSVLGMRSVLLRKVALSLLSLILMLSLRFGPVLASILVVVIVLAILLLSLLPVLAARLGLTTGVVSPGPAIERASLVIVGIGLTLLRLIPVIKASRTGEPLPVVDLQAA